MIYTEMTKKAIKLMFAVHKDQKDRSGLPYVFHPYHLAEQMDEEDVVVVALLHDVVEDSNLTVKDLLQMGFSQRVCEAIALLTHQPEEAYFDYIDKIKGNELAKKVKLADLSHNSDSSRLDYQSEKDRQRIEKYRMAMERLQGE